jgi:3-phenylpropionate/trans-cinnamate dioxygenase ferredoxin subunit
VSQAASATRTVVGRVEDFPPGTKNRVEVGGRAIAVFNVDGRFYALRDVCPHMGGVLSAGEVLGTITAERPGEYEFDCNKKYVRCPWHGFEYDLETGQSWFDPRDRVRRYAVSVALGADLGDGVRVEGPFRAETIPITVEENYVVIGT